MVRHISKSFGGAGAEYAQQRGFDARNRTSSPLGSMSVGPVAMHLNRVKGASRTRGTG
jgi:hypothetical protein